MSALARLFELLLPVIEADLKTVLEPPEGSPPLFYRMMHYHMGWVDQEGQPSGEGGGKRVRPVLCLLVCEALNGSYERARPAAAAVELIHNFSLLHDDIQDKSPIRRRRPTVWSIWGEAQAINAGDALFALAHLAIPRLSQPQPGADIQAQTLRVLSETSLELTRGQHLDLRFEEQSGVGPEAYLDMVAGKTAALIGAAALLGAIASGADEAVQARCHAFGHNLGMAFQVRDDVLDIWGDPSLTGKEVAIDIRQRKKSLPVVYALEASGELRALYEERQPFDEAMVSRAIGLLDEVGAREYAEEQARHYSTETLIPLEALSLGNEAGEALFEMVHTLLQRER